MFIQQNKARSLISHNTLGNSNHLCFLMWHCQLHPSNPWSKLLLSNSQMSLCYPKNHQKKTRIWRSRWRDQCQGSHSPRPRLLSNKDYSLLSERQAVEPTPVPIYFRLLLRVRRALQSLELSLPNRSISRRKRHHMGKDREHSLLHRWQVPSATCQVSLKGAPMTL